MNLEPFEFTRCKEMLRIFNGMYVKPGKARHHFLDAPNALLIEKYVTTKGVNEFVLKHPNKVDRRLFEAFAAENEIKYFKLSSNIEEKKED